MVSPTLRSSPQFLALFRGLCLWLWPIGQDLIGDCVEFSSAVLRLGFVIDQRLVGEPLAGRAVNEAVQPRQGVALTLPSFSRKVNSST